MTDRVVLGDPTTAEEKRKESSIASTRHNLVNVAESASGDGEQSTCKETTEERTGGALWGRPSQ